MGAKVSQCAADGPGGGELLEQSYPPVADVDAAIPTKGVEKSKFGGCSSLPRCNAGENYAPPRCDVAEECLAAHNIQVVALNDKECADVLLVQASKRGDILDVERALKTGATVDTCAELALNMGARDTKRIKRITPLMHACEGGHRDVVICLLEAGADPVRCDSRRWTPICYALGAGEIELASVMFKRMKSSKADDQKVYVQRLQKQLLESCEEAAGEERVAELRQALCAGGFLAVEFKRV